MPQYPSIKTLKPKSVGVWAFPTTADKQTDTDSSCFFSDNSSASILNDHTYVSCNHSCICCQTLHNLRTPHASQDNTFSTSTPTCKKSLQQLFSPVENTNNLLHKDNFGTSMESMVEYEPDVSNDIDEAEEIEEWDTTVEEVNDRDFVTEKKFIVFENNLLVLFKFCFECGSTITEKEFKSIGTRIYVKSKCHNGHENVWCNQPFIGKRGCVNLIVPAATLYCGLSYKRLKEWSDVINLALPSETNYYDVQAQFLFPTVNEQWQKHQEEVFGFIGNNEVTLLGDGRCDSPGYSAK